MIEWEAIKRIDEIASLLAKLVDNTARLPPESLAVIASRYKERVTIYSVTASPQQKILDADPHRWHVRFENTNNATMNCVILPVASTNVAPIGGQQPNSISIAYRDRPSAVIGEWYVFAPFAGSSIIITETLYMG